MAEFTAITSQEQLENVLKDRLDRQKGQHIKEMQDLEAKFSDYDSIKEQLQNKETEISTLKEQIELSKGSSADFEKTIAELKEKNASYETQITKSKVASEFGLSADAVGFLQGDDEASIRESAEALKSLVGASRTAPLANPEGDSANSKDAALLGMLKEL